jgi:hypothetical protein
VVGSIKDIPRCTEVGPFQSTSRHGSDHTMRTNLLPSQRRVSCSRNLPSLICNKVGNDVGTPGTNGPCTWNLSKRKCTYRTTPVEKSSVP